MLNKNTNHLGSAFEKLSDAGSNLPSLSKQLNLLQDATKELKAVLIDCLPREVLENCWVVSISTDSLTLAVSSATASNHINYMKQAYIQILQEQSCSFSQIRDLKVIVAHIKN